MRRKLVEKEEHGVLAGAVASAASGVHTLGEASASLAEEEAHQRPGTAQVRRRHGEVEAPQTPPSLRADPSRRERNSAVRAASLGSPGGAWREPTGSRRAWSPPPLPWGHPLLTAAPAGRRRELRSDTVRTVPGPVARPQVTRKCSSPPSDPQAQVRTAELEAAVEQPRGEARHAVPLASSRI